MSGRTVPRLFRPARRTGVTLVELLVVIALFSLLLGLTLPAVHSARERGRRVTCQNNLRQLALAALSYESSRQAFPSGGWGAWWIGVPEQGLGPDQPGGWPYSLLRFLGRNDLADLGRDKQGSQREKDLAQLLQVPLPVFHCPSRRPAVLYPVAEPYARYLRPGVRVSAAPRSDYAANAGGQPRCEIAGWGGPDSLQQARDPQFRWPDTSDHNGVIYLRSRVTAARIINGLSRTYLFGEKYVDPQHYNSGRDHGDDWNLYTGYQDDTHRSGYWRPRRDGTADPRVGHFSFGSAHPDEWNVAFCDGHVRSISYSIYSLVHQALAARNDKTIFGDEHVR